MIFLIVMLCCVCVCSVSCTMLYFNKKKIPADVKDPDEILHHTPWYWLQNIFFSIFISVLIIIAVATACNNEEAKRLYDETENLNLYVEVIDESDNEYLRYHFWNKVYIHNSNVDRLRAIPENRWYGRFIFHPELYENIPYVNFSLNGG